MMSKIDREELTAFVKQNNERAKCVFIRPQDLIFEENVKMNCFYCGKYNSNWRCPPNLPDIDYKRMMGEYDSGMFVVLEYSLTEGIEFDIIRSESSIILHKLLLSLEKWLWRNNCPTALSFIGGSCKLCKGGCGKERCNNPYMSRSPIEATGIHVVKSARKYGIDIEFPTEKKLMRIGLLLWQEVEE